MKHIVLAASRPMKVKFLTFSFLVSKTAADSFPHAVQVLFDTFFQKRFRHKSDQIGSCIFDLDFQNGKILF